MKAETIRIRFQGERRCIDANTLINFLVHYNGVIDYIHKRTNEDGRKLSVRVDAIEKGSFVICLSLQETMLESLFSASSVTYLAGVVTIAGGVYKLYKHFKGRRVKTADEESEANALIKNVIESRGGNVTVINIVNIYNESAPREAIGRQFDTLSADEGVDGVEMEYGNGQCEAFVKSEFDALRYKKQDEDCAGQGDRTEEEEVTLRVTGLNFERGKHWSFLYKGFRITIPVGDDALMRKIDDGERFGKGDSMRVRLRVVKRFNKELGDYENHSYKIVEFLEHIISPPEPRLF